MSMGNRTTHPSCLKQKKEEKKSFTLNLLNGASDNCPKDSSNIVREVRTDSRHITVNGDENDNETDDKLQSATDEPTGSDDKNDIKIKQGIGEFTKSHRGGKSSIKVTCLEKEQIDDPVPKLIGWGNQNLKEGINNKDKRISQTERRLAFKQASIDIKEKNDKAQLSENTDTEDTSINITKSDMDKLSALLCELKTDKGVYNEILGKVYTIVKQQNTDKHNQQAAQMLINEHFLNKMDTYLHCSSINSFIEFKADDELARKAWPAVKKFLTISWIVCDRDVNFCQYVLESKTFLFLLSELRSLSAVNYENSDMFLFTIKATLGILHNISRHVPNSKWNLRNEGLVTILRTFLPSHVPMIRLKTLIILSYILSEAENEIINSDDDNFVFIFQVLSDALKSDDHRSKKYGLGASEVLRGINNLAINEENKIRIVRNGALPLYETILVTEGFAEEKKVTIMSLWSLAFHHYNKRKMRDMPGIMEKLYELRQCEDEEICHAARGTFWELENTSKTLIGNTFSSSAERDTSQPHIMISYQWDSQPIMIKVKDRLRHAGYKVWMDVEHMTGSTLEAMALAVEKAAVILICMSQKYKDSPNCRTEAEYVYRLRKDFVPLRLQCEYAPDGWLGILVGTRLYFDMYSEETLDTQLPKLVKELRDRGRVSPSLDTPDIGSLVPRRMISREAVPLLHMSEPVEVKNWDTQTILDWLTSLGMEDIYERLYGIDGSLLIEMQKIQKAAPEFFYTMLREDLKLTTVTILKFSKAIRCLR